MRYNAERGSIITGWQYGADKLESFKIFPRFLIARYRVPRVEDNHFRLKLPNCRRKLHSEILTAKTHSKRRRRTDADVVFERVAVQFSKLL